MIENKFFIGDEAAVTSYIFVSEEEVTASVSLFGPDGKVDTSLWTDPTFDPMHSINQIGEYVSNLERLRLEISAQIGMLEKKLDELVQGVVESETDSK